MCDKERGLPVAQSAHARQPDAPLTRETPSVQPQRLPAEPSAPERATMRLQEKQRVQLMLAQIPRDETSPDYYPACLQLAGALGIQAIGKDREVLNAELKHALALVFVVYTDYERSVPKSLRV